jgi:bifunctional non-homologous end joining protein LigD
VAPARLATYDAKRDFSRTREPSGASRAAASERLRFVVQKHAARRLHYDLRLELGGTFKSWAVTRGPSLDPADKRLAVEVEDHPLAYGDFEGTIPAGEYGGGTVQLWDRGYWQPVEGMSPEQSLKQGELKFSLDGKRLHGGWVLVRMRNDRDGGKRTNWLLIKHRDAAVVGGKSNGHAVGRANGKPMAEDQSIASGRSMAQIAAHEGPEPTPFMKMAPRPASQSKAIKLPRPSKRSKVGARVPAFVEPQLCKLLEHAPPGDAWVHEIKLDGYRIQIRVADGRATLKTRKGLDWTDKFGSIAAAAAALPDCLIDGELCALDREQRSSFAALQAALSEDKTESLVFFAFDLLYLEGRDLRPSPLLERKAALQELLRARRPGALRYVDHVVGDADEVWRTACSLDLEGIVSKRADAPYESGRTGSWTKTKCRASQEIIVCGWTHEGKQVRSLLAAVMQGGKLTYVGRVGTGFGEGTSREIYPRMKALTRSRSPFHGDPGAPLDEKDVSWLNPKLVAEVEFAGWTGDGKLRQASFKGLRLDKPAREVVRERAAPVSATATPRDDGTTVTLTHPDKVLWPATRQTPEATKQDLADYYAEIAEWMLPHIEGRPCSLVRAPDGIGGQHFFQRHAMAGHSPLLKLVKVRGDKQPYLQIDTRAALQATAQLAGLELHPWNCAPGDPDQPGRLVFDIDPAPDVKFARVVAAALELRKRLQKLGLNPFCKTTGGKGLHVVVPLVIGAGKAEAVNWQSAKLFSQTVCAQLAADDPQGYLITQSKAARKGRIFLDYLRNDRTATAVAPLSPRARPGATVSMPLHWSQVRASLDPAKYTIHTTPGLLAKEKPWSDYDKSAVSLAAAAKRLLESR